MLEYIRSSAADFDISVRALSIRLTKPAAVDRTYSYVNGPPHGPTWFRKIFYGANLLRALKKEVGAGARVVHLLWVGFPVLTPFIIKRLRRAGINTLVTVLNRHTPPERYQHANLVIVQSDETLATYKHAGYPLSNLELIAPPVDLERFRPSDTPAEPFFVMASGPRTAAQIRERGILLLFEAFEELARRGSPARLCFFGRWRQGKHLLEEIRSRFPSANITMRHDYSPELPRLIARSSGVIIPYTSNRIGEIPMSALEAMACGRAVIATEGIGLNEYLVDQDAGIQIQPDPTSLANAVERVLENPDSWRSSGLEAVKNLDAKGFGQRMCSIYSALLEN